MRKSADAVASIFGIMKTGPRTYPQIQRHPPRRDGSKLSTIELKKFCSENLPLYMVPDRFCGLESLPKTSTDKIDYQKLKSMK
jgi:acyl-CoA synthetase (AMP-forming)/AMP-acid ligase II